VAADPGADLGRYTSRVLTALRWFCQRVAFRALVVSQVRVDARLAPELDDLTGPFVVVANHSSHLDGPMIQQNLPWRLARHLSTGVAADYWFRSPVRRAFVRVLFNAYPIDRDGSRANSGMSRRLLDAGVPILVFPEGTRSRTGRLGHFKPGAAALAQANQVPVVPVALIGGHEAMPKGARWPVPGRPPVRIVVGAPVRGEPGEKPARLMARIKDGIARMYSENAVEVLGTDPWKDEND
jgi:1-acyl-sn-glycerol-3-phosphate acyltransferase